MKNALTYTLNESESYSLGRVLFHTINSNVAVLTAHKSHLITEQNNIRNEILKQKIKDAGYGYIRIRSNEQVLDTEARKLNEVSLLVIGLRGRDDGQLLNQAKIWGEEYDQVAILHKFYNSKEGFLHGTSRDSDDWPKYGEAEPVGRFHPNKIAEFYSTLTSGKPFTFLPKAIDLTQPDAVFISDQPNYWRSKERAEQLYNGLTPSNEIIEKEKRI